eukprot:scaffold1184_cov132-Cylindrotheca_fusiformis.AAC.99
MMLSHRFIAICSLLVWQSVGSAHVEVKSHSEDPSNLGLCQGDCDRDSHCQEGLYCFQRDANEPVPGCEGGESDSSLTDYCIENNPSDSNLVFYGSTPAADHFPLGRCEGDCDYDSQCQPGLICFQRHHDDPVPGCASTESSETDYCVDPEPTQSSNEYTAGKLTVQKLGLLLSEGLDARILATTGQKVILANGKKSKKKFHANPDAGATFPDDRDWNKGGWIYVSNAEVRGGKGGVGALTFDKNGKVIDFNVLLKKTNLNCGGGRTPWNTWISAEEFGDKGQLYQVDPTGRRHPEVLTLGYDGGSFESFAYDIRDRNHPHFFVTEDHRRGALQRFTPHSPNWDDPWRMLHASGEVHYLLLSPKKDGRSGKFEWTTDRARARDNAEEHYRHSEGIDVKGSKLYFVCKERKHLFILDLNRGKYTRESTVFGLFDGQPDQLERILEGSSELLYFTEEGGRDAGVHARDRHSRYFTILESPVYDDETTGLSFSPDGRFMYVAYQHNGLLFAVWRQDGAPFHQREFDIKYHK